MMLAIPATSNSTHKQECFVFFLRFSVKIYSKGFTFTFPGNIISKDFRFIFPFMCHFLNSSEGKALILYLSQMQYIVFETSLICLLEKKI